MDRMEWQDVKKFVIRLSVFLAAALITDRLAGALLSRFYFSQESGADKQAVYSMNSAEEDLLVFGSSRASHHYVPPVLEQGLEMTAYNVGREGNFILYSTAVLRSVTQRYLPKIIVLDISRREFEAYQGSYDQLSSLLPFYRSHPEIRDIVQMRGPFERLKLLSAVYPFNSLIATIVVGNLEFNKKRKADIQGYDPLFRSMNRPPLTIPPGDAYPIDPKKVDAYREFLRICRDKHIPLYIVCSPYYDTLDIAEPSVAIAAKIAAEEHVPFWNHTLDTVYTGKAECFFDDDHLNDQAARNFSRSIAARIRTNHDMVEKTTHTLAAENPVP